MLFETVTNLYKRLRLQHYQRLFSRIREKAGSLSATEAFSLDAIYILNEPTIKQFADFLGISQPNASYKVGSLISKGYIQKIPSPEDGREYRLKVAEHFYAYYDEDDSRFQAAMEKLEERYGKQELERFEEMVSLLGELL